MHLHDEHVVVVRVLKEALAVARGGIHVDADGLVQRFLQRAAQLRDGYGSVVNPVEDERVSLIVSPVGVVDVRKSVRVQRDRPLRQHALGVGADDPQVVTASCTVRRRHPDQRVDIVDARQTRVIRGVVSVHQQWAFLPVLVKEGASVYRRKKPIEAIGVLARANRPRREDVDRTYRRQQRPYFADALNTLCQTVFPSRERQTIARNAVPKNLCSHHCTDFSRA